MTTETKSEKFRRLSGARLPKVLHSIGLLGNLAGSAYEATPAEAQDLVDQLTEAVDEVAQAFKIPRVGSDDDDGGFWRGRPGGLALTTNAAGEPVGATLDLPNFADAGPRPVDGIGAAESLKLIRTGPLIGAAIDAIDDGDVAKAKRLLLDVMAS